MAGKTTIGKLNAILTLNSDAFNKGLRGAKTRLGKFTSGIASGVASIAKYGAAMAAVAGGAFVYFARQQLGVIDSIAKTSRALGISTEALSGLQHAAAIAGVSSADLETAFRRMEKTVGDAKVGLSTAVRALDALGLSTKQLDALSPDEQFKLIAERLRGVATQSDKARIAQDLFGRSGVKLIPLLDEGAAGIAALQDEAKRLGITFDEEAAAKVEMANDAMTRLKGLLTGALRTAVIQLAPFVQAVADRLTEAGAAGGGMGEKVSNAFAMVLKVAAKLADWFELLKAGFYGLQTVVTGGLTFIFKAVDDLVAGLEKLLKLIGVQLPEGIRDFTKAMTEGLEQDTVDAAKKAGEAFDRFLAGDASKRADAFIKGIQEGADKAAKELAAKARANLPSGLLDAAEEGKGSFAQIVRSRTAFGAPTAPGARKTLTVDGMNQAVDMLNQIRMLLKVGLPGRAL